MMMLPGISRSYARTVVAERGGVTDNKKEDTHMEIHEKEWASKGVAGAGLGTGIAGLSLGVLNSGLLGSLGFGGKASCPDQVYVNRYEAGQSARIAELETEVKLRDSNIYTDGKILDLYKYVDGEIKGINAQLCAQAVVNAQVTANISCMQNAINVLNGLTKTVIPIGNVCPAPMPQYNSWTAPTTT